MAPAPRRQRETYAEVKAKRLAKARRAASLRASETSGATAEAWRRLASLAADLGNRDYYLALVNAVASRDIADGASRADRASAEALAKDLAWSVVAIADSAGASAELRHSATDIAIGLPLMASTPRGHWRKPLTSEASNG